MIISNMAAAEETWRVEAVFPRSYQDESYQRGFLGSIGDLQKAGVLQDVILEIEDRQFPCHRLVLSAASPYFRAMFSDGMAESRQKSVVLQSMDGAMFEEILNYIYSGTINVSLDTVQPLYQAADLLQVDYVRETCSSYMAMNVERATCLDLYMFADVFSVGNVRKRCLQYICRYFEKVSTTAEFCSLSVDQLTDIISQDELDVKEETTVWEAVVRWVVHSREDRQPHIRSILSHIRFNLLTSEDTAAILEHPLVREDPGSSQVIRNVAQRGTSKLRFGMDTQELILLVSQISDEMFCLNPNKGQYIRCPVKGNPYDHVQAITVTCNNDIYILAGEYRTPLALLMYNHLENKWEQQSSLPKADDALSDNIIVEAGGYLYHLAFFSPRGEDECVLMRKYDNRRDHWLECSQLLLTSIGDGDYTDSGKAVSCGGQIYFMTGTQWYRYHPCDNQWYKMTLPNRYLRYMIYTIVASETEIFCEDRFMYDTSSDTWSDLPVWTAPYTGFANDLFVREGQLHMVIYHTSDVPVGDQLARIVKAFQICVLDRSEGTWTDLKVTLPDDWMENLSGDFDEFPCVARMYLPSLNASVRD